MTARMTLRDMVAGLREGRELKQCLECSSEIEILCVDIIQLTNTATVIEEAASPCRSCNAFARHRLVYLSEYDKAEASRIARDKEQRERHDFYRSLDAARVRAEAG